MHERAREGESLAQDEIVKNISELPTESTTNQSFDYEYKQTWTEPNRQILVGIETEISRLRTDKVGLTANLGGTAEV